MRTLLRCLAVLLLFAVGSLGPPVHAAPPAALAQTRVPPEALKVLAYVRSRHEAPPGHVGGRRFGNFESRLPKVDGRGRRIAYQEWDVFPKVQGRNRGAHRLVTGSDGRAWHTGDHYGTFTEIKEPR
ncbi:MAG: ribonuclease [Holophagaceae bacterium]|nr:ribonuclease [Holophagaceae bacterium]